MKIQTHPTNRFNKDKIQSKIEKSGIRFLSNPQFGFMKREDEPYYLIEEPRVSVSYNGFDFEKSKGKYYANH